LRGLDVRSVNIPYLLAQNLRRFTAGRKSRAHISNGKSVSRLAEHFGLMTAKILGGLKVIAPKLPIIDMGELVRIKPSSKFNIIVHEYDTKPSRIFTLNARIGKSDDTT
ncbi:hypothetical protein Tco_0070000, partial [Tanacetum coccineum]